MTPLRRQMINAMRLRGFSERTHSTYLAAVAQLAVHYHRSPERISREELQSYFAYLAMERSLSAASCRLYFNAIRFLYLQVLNRQSFDVDLVLPKVPQRLPELLTRDEVRRLIETCTNTKHRTLLMLCYGCGLRVSELVAVKVRDIDGERRLLRVDQGKGCKDRYVIIGERLLEALRRYWQERRPRHWLFPSAQRPRAAVTISTAQRVFSAAKRRAQISKNGGIHALRHAYATHQLDSGVAVHQLQRMLGHRHLQTTLRYLHWVPQRERGTAENVDLLAALDRSDG